MQAVGSRSFGPLLLVAGLVTLSPAGDVPGVPTIMAAFVFLVAGQLPRLGAGPDNAGRAPQLQVHLVRQARA